MKKLLSLILVFSITLSLCPFSSLADTFMLPDPLLTTGWAENITLDRTEKYDDYCISVYTAPGDTAADYAMRYFDLLSQQQALHLDKHITQDYAGFTGVFYCFTADGIPSSMAFEGITDGAAVVLYYDQGGGYSAHNIALYYDNGFSFNMYPPATPVPTPTPAPTVKAQATVRSMLVVKATPTPGPTVRAQAVIRNTRAASITATPAPITVCSNNGLTLANPITYFGGGYTYNGNTSFTAQDMEIVLTKDFNTGYDCSAIFKFDTSRNAAADAQAYAQALESSGYYTLEMPNEKTWQLYYIGPESPAAASPTVAFHFQILLLADKMLFLFGRDLRLTTTDAAIR